MNKAPYNDANGSEKNSQQPTKAKCKRANDADLEYITLYKYCARLKVEYF